jgi:hypothetical protein
MSPDSGRPGFVRPAAVVNEEIRALFARAGGRLYGKDRAEYERLVVEWIRAVAAERQRIEVVEAA